MHRNPTRPNSSPLKVTTTGGWDNETYTNYVSDKPKPTDKPLHCTGHELRPERVYTEDELRLLEANKNEQMNRGF